MVLLAAGAKSACPGYQCYGDGPSPIYKECCISEGSSVNRCDQGEVCTDKHGCVLKDQYCVTPDGSD